ncbi:MAG: RnfABCDGE type electron transport complex subunit B [Candidatus Cloacimonetes bacterium]|nr:RnfABCDGE type electron transport complex subunit B [Candidatus Cloacimonadota bacterium]
MGEIWIPVLVIGGLGGIFGLALAYVSKVFYVKIDERIEKIIAVLPGANCGACGFAGCSNYADVIVKKDIDFTLCPPGGSTTAGKIAEIMGKVATETERRIAIIHCSSGGYKNTVYRFEYQGIPNCQAAALLNNGPNACNMGCLYQNDCIAACKFGAITLTKDGLKEIDNNKCTGCGNCAKVCPKNLIEIVPVSRNVYVKCSSTEKGTFVRQNCGDKSPCVSCGLCVRKCPVSAIEIKNELAVIDYEKCIDCGVCAIHCPTRAIIDTKTKRGKAVISEIDCIGCLICTKICPVLCISGELKQPHKIDDFKCIGCEVCLPECPQNAIYMKY